MKSAYICIYMVEPQVIDPNRAAAQNWLLTFYIHLVFFLGQNKSPCKILSESVEKQQRENYFFATADLRPICPKVWNTEIQANLVLCPWWSRFPPWMFFFCDYVVLTTYALPNWAEIATFFMNYLILCYFIYMKTDWRQFNLSKSMKYWNSLNLNFHK